MTEFDATYSPEDNKLRLYAAYRLDNEDYQKIKKAGFRWAPKQELFVAPRWTPAREDVLLEFVDEIGDEDSFIHDLHENKPDEMWVHDVVAVAVYLCKKCLKPVAIMNQA